MADHDEESVPFLRLVAPLDPRLPDRSILKPTMVAASRIAAGTGARYTHRELVRRLHPLARFGYDLARIAALSRPTHARRAQVMAFVISMTGALHDGEVILELPVRLDGRTMERIE